MARSERHADVRRPPVGALPKVPHRNELRCRLTALKIANYAENDFRMLQLQADAKLCSFRGDGECVPGQPWGSASHRQYIRPGNAHTVAAARLSTREDTARGAAMVRYGKRASVFSTRSAAEPIEAPDELRRNHLGRLLRVECNPGGDNESAAGGTGDWNVGRAVLRVTIFGLEE
jgi:hypothetical protein